MCFGGRGDDAEAKRSREIDVLLHRDEKVMQKVVKLLLLGKPSEYLALLANSSRSTVAGVDESVD